MKGYVQVYTGDGKGKTTAAVGLAVRAVGAGLTVCIVQLAKGRFGGEHAALERLGDRITVTRFGSPNFVVAPACERDIQLARDGIEFAHRAMLNGSYDVVIVDEANTAADLGLISSDDLVALIETKPDTVELVLTGRNAHPDVIARADLVTEMREIKHYFNASVPARKGIEF